MDRGFKSCLNFYASLFHFNESYQKIWFYNVYTTVLRKAQKPQCLGSYHKQKHGCSLPSGQGPTL